MTSSRFQRVAAADFPGVEPMELPPWSSLQSRVEGSSGSGWQDHEFASEARALHERLGAAQESQKNLAALADGEASCVITGQQPGLLGGPLYLAYKVAGTVGLAKKLSETSGRPVVPVYWCGADDSDFDELRVGWLWGECGASRAELPREILPMGSRVGSLRDERIAAVEREAISHVLRAPGRDLALAPLDRLDPSFDFGERAMARLLHLFAEAGLVVVDARSARLRLLGHELFERYAAEHDSLTEALLNRRHDLLSRGKPAPIAEDALRSGLFVLEAETRRKIDSPDLRRAVAERPADLAPAVALRPLWQDWLLRPVTAVLGPSELAYHRQLDPLFEGLGVMPAARLPRPHVLQYPRALLPALDGDAASRPLHELLRDQQAARQILASRVLEAELLGAIDCLGSEVEEAYARAEQRLSGAVLDASRERFESELGRLRDELASMAMTERVSGGIAWEEIPRFLFPRGRAQERVFSSDLGPALHGQGWEGWLAKLAADAAQAYGDSVYPCFAAECGIDMG